MDQQQFNIGLMKFKRALSESYLNTLGKVTNFSQKLRRITPFKLCACLIACFSTPLETISDIHRSFNELSKACVQYKSFHKQLAKETFPNFMRQVVSHLLNKLTGKILVLDKNSPFSKFSNIYIQDGTAYGIKSSLMQEFPGKFEQAPAAVQLHTTMSLLEDEAIAITLTPFIEAETNYLPDKKDLAHSLLLADRCYLNIPYMYAINQSDGSFILRGKHHINPLIKEAIVGTKKVKKFIGKKLKEIRIPKNTTLDLTGEWKFLGGKMQCRIIIQWNPTTKEYMYFVTNLPRIEFRADQVLLAYKLRWQIELLFKEWKSYANLQKFCTSNPHIAEGLIWASLAAAIVKRFIAHLAQRTKQVTISTRIVAMCTGRKIAILIEKLMERSHYSVNKYLLEMINYLGNNARRANPIRDRKKGRYHLGFFDIGVLKD